MPDTIEGDEGGSVSLQSASGPSSYDAGAGFTVASNLGRVNEFMVDSDGENNVPGNQTVTNDNEMVVQVFNQDGTGEIAGGTDISGTTFTFLSARL